jgi:hypothetical protein
MLNERAKREQLFFLYSLKTIKKKLQKCMFLNTAMGAMLRCSHFVNIQIQAIQT